MLLSVLISHALVRMGAFDVKTLAQTRGFAQGTMMI
jgi:hypothetical protein